MKWNEKIWSYFVWAIYSPSHLTPCRKSPYKSDPQWSQNVGDINVHALNRCGKSILNLSLRYYIYWYTNVKTKYILRQFITHTYQCTFRIETGLGTSAQQFSVTSFMDSRLTFFIEIFVIYWEGKKLIYSYSYILMHWYPCLPKPHRNSLQNTQNVGWRKNFATNLWPLISCARWCLIAPRRFVMLRRFRVFVFWTNGTL